MKELFNEFAEQYFIMPGEFMKSANLQLIRSGKNIAKPNYCIGPKVIPYYGLHFVLDGYVKFTQGDQEYILGKGDLFCLFPNEIFTYEIHMPLSQTPPLQLYWLTMYGEFVPKLLSRIGLDKSHPAIRNLCTEKTIPFLDRILEASRQENGTDKVLKLIHEITGLFANLSAKIKLNTSSAQQIHWLRKGLDYIQMHFRDNILVSDVAQNVGVDRNHFTRTFQHAMNISPNAYIQNLRLKEANYLLWSTDLTIKEVAASLGYTDPYTFTRAYKKKYGVPPSVKHKRRRSLPLEP